VQFHNKTPKKLSFPLSKIEAKGNPAASRHTSRVKGSMYKIAPSCYLLDVTGLDHKVVLVTGASGGIGRALVRAFSSSRCRTVITSRSQAKLDTLAQELNGEGGSVLSVAADVTRRDQLEALNGTIEKRLGPVQILINNAGIAPAVSFLDMTDELWEKVLDLNLTGTYNCCKIFLPRMIQSGWGRIINIASTMGKVSYSHVSAYSSSKHGVLGLTRSLALETARYGVTVNAICPGYVDNELTRENARRMAEKTGKSPEEILALFSRTSPQNRLIRPEEVAGLAVLLASEKLGGMTGQAISVDGGATMV
jgi:NAD(P)-dependent dehydrogenase (short-subunit alcohol dehydrogenase family)